MYHISRLPQCGHIFSTSRPVRHSINLSRSTKPRQIYRPWAGRTKDGSISKQLPNMIQLTETKLTSCLFLIPRSLSFLSTSCLSIAFRRTVVPLHTFLHSHCFLSPRFTTGDRCMQTVDCVHYIHRSAFQGDLQTFFACCILHHHHH